MSKLIFNILIFTKFVCYVIFSKNILDDYFYTPISKNPKLERFMAS